MKSIRILPVAALALGLVSCQGKDAPDAKGGKDKAKPQASIAAWVARDTIVDRSVQGVGTLVPEAQVDLKAEIAGRVASVGFREGQPVKQGQILVKLVDQDLAATRDKAKAVADFARQTLQRRKDQLAVQAVAQQDVDAAAQALASAEADLRFAEAQLSKTEIRSPLTGRVGISNVAVGQYLSPGQAVATVARTRPLKVDFQVPGDDVSRVRSGMALRFRPYGAKEWLEAPIYATDPLVDSSARTLRVRALWKGAAEGLVAGTAVEVKVGLSRGRAFLMPPQALGADARGPSVIVLRDGKATPVPVVVGRRTAEAVEIAQGLKAGDTVLVAGATPVKPGSPVVPARYL
jgi:membrane fusion protein (multidrug efflux system)